MKLLKSLVGVAAVLSVVPYKVEKKDCDGKKAYSFTSLTWKADYTPNSEEEPAMLSIDLLGGLSETVSTVKDLLNKEATPDFCETVTVEVAPDPQEETL